MGNPFPVHHILEKTLGLLLTYNPRKKHEFLPKNGLKEDEIQGSKK